MWFVLGAEVIAAPPLPLLAGLVGLAELEPPFLCLDEALLAVLLLLLEPLLPGPEGVDTGNIPGIGYASSPDAGPAGMPGG